MTGQKGLMGAGYVLYCRCTSPRWGQEGGKRAGTKNVMHIVGLGQAEELLASNYKWGDNAACTESMRSQY